MSWSSVVVVVIVVIMVLAMVVASSKFHFWFPLHWSQTPSVSTFLLCFQEAEKNTLRHINIAQNLTYIFCSSCTFQPGCLQKDEFGAGTVHRYRLAACHPPCYTQTHLHTSSIYINIYIYNPEKAICATIRFYKGKSSTNWNWRWICWWGRTKERSDLNQSND